MEYVSSDKHFNNGRGSPMLTMSQVIQDGLRSYDKIFGRIFAESRCFYDMKCIGLFQSIAISKSIKITI